MLHSRGPEHDCSILCFHCSFSRVYSLQAIEVLQELRSALVVAIQETEAACPTLVVLDRLSRVPHDLLINNPHLLSEQAIDHLSLDNLEALYHEVSRGITWSTWGTTVRYHVK